MYFLGHKILALVMTIDYNAIFNGKNTNTENKEVSFRSSLKLKYLV